MMIVLIALAFVLLPGAAGAQSRDFAGRYVLQAPDGEQIVVELAPQGGGRYGGTLRKGALEWRLLGDLDEGVLVGTVQTPDAMLGFEASLTPDQLELILANVGPDGMPDVENAQQLMFTRVADGAASAGGAPSAPLSSAWSRPSAGAGGADPFSGTFSDGTWRLTLQPGGQGYTGSLGLGQEAYPVSAVADGSGLSGTMTAPTGQYGFRLTMSADGVVLDNAGQQFALTRVADGPATTWTPGPAQPSPAQPSPSSGGSAGVQDNSPLAQQWRAHLAGKKVTYISSYNSGGLDGGGMTTKNVYHICSDGSFAYSDQSAISLQNPGTPDLGTPGVSARGSGTWRIVTQGQQAGIELRFHSGEVQLYGLDYRDGATYADGTRVYVTPGEQCS